MSPERGLVADLTEDVANDPLPSGQLMTAADVSVVVCTYHDERLPLLEQGLRAVRQQRWPAAEVIVVVDHNSGLLARLQESYPGLTVIPNEQARGLSGARNTGLVRASGDIVAFLDDDAVPEPDWVGRLAAAYEPGVLGVGGLIVPNWAGGRPPWFPAEFDWVVGCTYRGSRPDAGPVRNVLGANMSFRSHELREIGGFRDGIGRIGRRPLGCEETEACLRLAARWPGCEIRYEPAARVHHYVPSERGTWTYLLRRCWAEGVSKARVAALAGRTPALATERTYALRTLSRAAGSGVAEGVRKWSAAPLARACTVVVGLAVTTAGFAAGSAGLSRRVSPTRPVGHRVPVG